MHMPFGKYRGVDLMYVPENYLIWVLGNVGTLDPVVREAIRVRLGLMAWQQPPRTSLDPAQITEGLNSWLRSVYRELSARFHPDHRGGSNEAMIAINCMHERLCETLPLQIGEFDA